MSFFVRKSSKSIPIVPVAAQRFDDWLKKQDPATKAAVKAAGFRANQGSVLIVPASDGQIEKILFGNGSDSLFAYAALPMQLPPQGSGYFIDADMDRQQAENAAIGWALGSYKFLQYKTNGKKKPVLLAVDATQDVRTADVIAAATYLVRDMVNMPANDMGPAEIAAAARQTVKPFKNADIKIITGRDLLKKNYPAIYAVGQGSPREPRLIDIRWGRDKKLPLVTLVGKGVAFDTGGLDIKTASGMLLMKKDMGGAAHVLGLAHIIMTLQLEVRLRVLIPAVENAVDGNSFRPGDIIRTRKGLTVEIGNTDAEGRVILSDALYEASLEKPDLLIDFATLTGAARVALGPELPALFSNNDEIAALLQAASMKVEDPLWRLPLWPGYADMLSSKPADMNNAGGSGFAGSITAALFLERFVEPGTRWIHIDTYAWNAYSRPGRPEGGEALGLRAVFELLRTRYGKAPKDGRKASPKKGRKQP